MGQHQNVLIMLKCCELGISLTSIPQILIAVTMFFFLVCFAGISRDETLISSLSKWPSILKDMCLCSMLFLKTLVAS